MTDHDADRLEAARRELNADHEVHSVLLDVRHEESWAEAADRIASLIGNVHVFCCNAGIAAGAGLVEDRSVADLDAVWQVNARGMFLGVKSLLPAMKAHGEEGHIVLTSSIMGLFAMPRTSIYCMTKYAALALAETLYLELDGTPLGVSVLCPGAVNTGLLTDVGRHLASQRGGRSNAASTNLLENGLSPDAVAARVCDAIADRELYIFSHPEYRTLVADRTDLILNSFGRAASPTHRDDLSIYRTYSGRPVDSSTG